MFGIIGYTKFLVSSLLINITPGADVIYVLSKSVTGGRKKGIASALGICTGILIHTIFVALGLTLILKQSQTAFNIIKLAGTAYLCIMGIRTILSKETIFDTAYEAKAESALKIYIQGILTNVLNPKVALFFLSLLPQFVTADNAYGALPFVLLGLTFFTTSTIWTVIVALCSSLVTKFIAKNKAVGKWTTKISGVVYILLGLNVLRSSN